MLQPYKQHYIHIAAVPAPSLSDGWYVRAWVLPPGKLTPVTEIKIFDETELVFPTKQEAEEHALFLSKAWIDARVEKLESWSVKLRKRRAL